MKGGGGGRGGGTGEGGGVHQVPSQHPLNGFISAREVSVCITTPWTEAERMQAARGRETGAGRG